MTGRQIAKRKMFGKVEKFGEDFSADFPANSRGAKLFTQLKAVNARIDRLAAQQDGGPGGTLTKEQAFALLHDLMEGIAATARTVARTLNKPGLRADLRLEDGANEQEWLTAAQRFVNRFDPEQHADAIAVKDEFVEFEMHADFVTELDAYKTAVETAQDDQSGSVRTLTGATTGLTEDFAEGMTVANLFDTLCENRYGRNPQNKDARKLREWRQSRHIEAPDDPHPATPTTPQA